VCVCVCACVCVRVFKLKSLAGQMLGNRKTTSFTVTG
jgi:hypothetical protein